MVYSVTEDHVREICFVEECRTLHCIPGTEKVIDSFMNMQLWVSLISSIPSGSLGGRLDRTPYWLIAKLTQPERLSFMEIGTHVPLFEQRIVAWIVYEELDSKQSLNTQSTVPMSKPRPTT